MATLRYLHTSKYTQAGAGGVADGLDYVGAVCGELLAALCEISPSAMIKLPPNVAESVVEKTYRSSIVLFLGPGNARKAGY